MHTQSMRKVCSAEHGRAVLHLSPSGQQCAQRERALHGVQAAL